MRKVLAEVLSTALVASAVVLCMAGVSLWKATPAYGQSETVVCPEGQDNRNDNCKGTCTQGTCGVSRQDKCKCS